MLNILESKIPSEEKKQPEETDLIGSSETERVDFKNPESLRKFIKIIEQRIAQTKEKGNNDRIAELTRYLIALKKRLLDDSGHKR